ncbi:hypothetical protein Drorol1_Dr00009375 [Drosera rotundifolia]
MGRQQWLHAHYWCDRQSRASFPYWNPVFHGFGVRTICTARSVGGRLPHIYLISAPYYFSSLLLSLGGGSPNLVIMGFHLIVFIYMSYLVVYVRFSNENVTDKEIRHRRLLYTCGVFEMIFYAHMVFLVYTMPLDYRHYSLLMLVKVCNAAIHSAHVLLLVRPVSVINVQGLDPVGSGVILVRGIVLCYHALHGGPDFFLLIPNLIGIVIALLHIEIFLVVRAVEELGNDLNEAMGGLFHKPYEPLLRGVDAVGAGAVDGGVRDSGRAVGAYGSGIDIMQMCSFVPDVSLFIVLCR